MKKLNLLIVMLFVAVASFAHDIIILKNSTKIDAVIQEVGQNEIKYKKASNPKGPIFIISTSEINSIVYDNGEVQTFNNENQQPSYNNQPQQTYNNQPQQTYNNQPQQSNNNQPQQNNNNSTGSSFVLKEANAYSGITLNYSYYKFKDDAEDMKTLNGFNAGYMMQVPVYKNLVLLWAIEYQFAMNKKKEEGVTCEWMNHNIKLPLRLGFSMPFGKNSSFTLFFGPSFDFNVATVYREEYHGDYVEIDYVNGKKRWDVDVEKDSDSDSDYKTLGFFDIPLGLGFMYNYGHIGFKFQYEWGLVNRRKDGEYKIRADQLTAGLVIAF